VIIKLSPVKGPDAVLVKVKVAELPFPANEMKSFVKLDKLTVNSARAEGPKQRPSMAATAIEKIRILMKTSCE